MNPALAIFAQAAVIGVVFHRKADRIVWSVRPSFVMSRERIAKITLHERGLLELVDLYASSLASVVGDASGAYCAFPVPISVVIAVAKAHDGRSDT